jgi:hypothetical protein
VNTDYRFVFPPYQKDYKASTAVVTSLIVRLASGVLEKPRKIKEKKNQNHFLIRNKITKKLFLVILPRGIITT